MTYTHGITSTEGVFLHIKFFSKLSNKCIDICVYTSYIREVKQTKERAMNINQAFNYDEFYNSVANLNIAIENWCKAKETVISAINNKLVDSNLLPIMRDGLIDTLKKVQPPSDADINVINVYCEVLEKLTNLDICINKTN